MYQRCEMSLEQKLGKSSKGMGFRKMVWVTWKFSFKNKEH